MSIQRLGFDSFGDDLVPSTDGSYVLYSDYKALQSRVAELEIVVRKLAVALKQDYKNGDLHQHDEDGTFHHCSVCDLEELARKALEPK